MQTLSRCIRPDPDLGQASPVWGDEVPDPFPSPRKSETSDGQSSQNDVGKERGEVDDPPGGFDALQETGRHQDPREKQGYRGIQAWRSLKPSTIVYEV